MTKPPKSEQSCANCYYAHQRSYPHQALYCCRRSPDTSEHANRWPEVESSDWCGEWDFNEVAL
jgi:hypothetical protein